MNRRTNIDERQTFHVERHHLVRWVALRDGRTYAHRCALGSFEAVVHYIDEHAGEGVTTTMLWETLPEVPCTQASVAAAFLKERGCLDVRGRRIFLASNVFFEDAMTEIHALAEEPPDVIRRAETAQRHGDWPKAAALWREASQACKDDEVQMRYLRMAAWCFDMGRISREGGAP